MLVSMVLLPATGHGRSQWVAHSDSRLIRAGAAGVSENGWIVDALRRGYHKWYKWDGSGGRTMER